MITRMVEQREGEWLGPIDWSYDFTQHDWGHGGGTNPECVQRGKDTLKKLEDGMKQGKKYKVRCYGDYQEVLQVGMYDGWPYWKPVPSVLLKSWMGGEKHDFMIISDAIEIEDRASELLTTKGLAAAVDKPPSTLMPCNK